MKYSVVIIEDEKWLLKGIEKSFNWGKYDFYVKNTFSNADDFLEYIDEHSVDVVFTDIKMPKMDGLELISKVKLEMKKENIYFVIISAFDSYEYMRRAINLGVVDYLKKPINRKETDALLEKIHDLVSNNKNGEKQVIDNKDFQELIYYIKTHYMEKLTLNELSKKYYFNSNYLCLLFKKHLNTSFSNYIFEIRMEKAKELLLDNRYSVSDVAQMVGYSEYSYFNRSFKKYFGTAPSAFKNAQKDKLKEKVDTDEQNL